MGLLTGKRALVLGVANDKSLAWGITEALHREGAKIGLTYLNEAIEKRVRPLGEQIGAEIIAPCDVQVAGDLARLADQVKATWGGVDIVVHGIGFANKDELRDTYMITSKEGFMLAHDVSVWSFTELAQAMRPLMGQGSSLLTLSYFGAEKVMPHYNVMGVAKAALEASVKYLAAALGPDGIRVNGISAGPIRTLAASGIGDFRKILNHNAEKAPLRRVVTIEEVGNTALFLSSDWASGITGEITHVDAGYNIIGM